MPTQKISGGVVHDVPADLQKAIVADSKVREAWESLTSLARNEWICWTTAVKKAETRQEHIERLQEDLKAGKRRPCCWYGCIHRTDKKVSASVQALVVDKQSKTGK